LTGKVAKHIALTVNVTSVLSQSHVSAWGLAAGLKLF